MPQLLSWEAIEAIERGAYRVLLYGPPGTGKTRSAYEAARVLKKSLYNVTLTDETPAAELRGHFVPKSAGKWDFMYGPATRAFVEGAVLCLDEIDKASQDCLDFLHGLLNDLTVARLTLPTGEIITPADGFQVIATMNGELEGLQPSLQDRFSIAIEVTEPHPDAILALPQDLQGPAKTFESYESSQRPATIRRWAAFGELRELKGVGVENAAKAVFAHRAQELVDAYGFTAGITVVPEGPTDHVEVPETDEEACSCADCLLRRASAWSNYVHDRPGPMYDDDAELWYCPSCENDYSDMNRALTCCYDDLDWLATCRALGRSFVDV